MPNDKAAILIKKAALVIEKLSNHVLAPYELTSTQYKIMIMLYQSGQKPVRQTDIEARFALTNPTVTGILKNLEKKQLIRRIPNPEDGRSKLVMLTQQAIPMEDALIEAGEELERTVTAGLTQQEYAQLIALLRKVLATAKNALE